MPVSASSPCDERSTFAPAEISARAPVSAGAFSAGHCAILDREPKWAEPASARFTRINGRAQSSEVLSIMAKIYRDMNQEIVASVGEPFVVELEGNATTGYQWQLEFDESKLKLIGDEYQPVGVGGVGSSGQHRFTLQPVASGQASILARYKRAWEPEHLEQKEISLRIKK